MIHARIQKPCPHCGSPLVVRTNGETAEEFLGCQAYPECKFTQPIPVDIKLRMQGAPTLPGLE